MKSICLILTILALSIISAKTPQEFDIQSSMINPGRFLKFSPKYFVKYNESIYHDYEIFSLEDPFRPIQLATEFYSTNNSLGYTNSGFQNFSRIIFEKDSLDYLSNTIDIDTRENPIDSAYVGVLYEKSAFGGNAFHLNFERQLIGPFKVGLGFYSQGNDSTGRWQYQNSVHQPYLGAGRDSLTIPLNGQSLFMESSSLYPRIEYQDSIQLAQIYYYSNDVERDNHIKEKLKQNETSTQKIVEFHFPTYTETDDKSEWGLKYNLKLNQFKLKIHHYQSDRSSSYNGLSNRWPEYIMDDSSSVSLSAKEANSTFGENLSIAYQNLNVSIKNHFEFLEYESSLQHLNEGYPISSDFQSTSLSYAPQYFRSKFGLRRSSTGLDQEYYTFNYSLKTGYPSKWVHLNFESLKKNIIPSNSQLMIDRIQIPQYSNSNLVPTEIYAQRLSLDSLFKGKHSLWMNLTWEDKPLLPTHLPYSNTQGQLLDEKKAFQISQQIERELFSFGLNTEWDFANWNLGAFYTHSIRDKITTPAGLITNFLSSKEHLGGHIKWTTALLTKQNLGFQLGLYGRWNSGFYTWAKTASELQYAELVYLNPSLQMDFETRIKISAFEMYVGLLNIAHQKYNFAPGYTPVGAEFRWGILWNFKG